MKTIKIFFSALAVAFALTGCSAKWLDTEMTGAALTQDQFDALTGTGEGMVRGLYSNLYAVGGDNHDYFGQKSIDIATDLLSSDMAMTANAYGWFVDCAQRQACTTGAGRNSYFWGYYYGIIMNANAVIKKYAALETLTAEEKNYYAQALTLRSYCYYSLANWYSPDINDATPDPILGGVNAGKDNLGYYTVPVYTETDTTETGMIKEQGLSTAGEIRALVESDLLMAIAYFDEAAEEGYSVRESKLFVDKSIAEAFLAYNYLQSGKYPEAYDAAMTVIDNAGSYGYSILPKAEVLTTGFVDVNNSSWMWGLDVTTENYGGLASFWGHMDIHTYSYASAGATKGMDDILYAEIDTTDIRKQWFDEKQKCIPDWKFYDLNRGVTADQLDRRWQNDIVFMRIEEMYLIAAEAACRNMQDQEAKDILKVLLDQRDEVAAENLASLGNADLLKEIYFNWRVEMWGEGRALITFKRFGYSKVRGNNHFQDKKSDVSPTDYRILFMVPYGETSTNNAIRLQQNGANGEA